jgi:hypothetical protein
MRRGWPIVGAGALALVLMAGPALACGGLLAPNGTINLLRTSTLAAYHDGIEHYITGFEFNGGGGKFGSIIPLPDVPSKVIKGGDWTLQRLQIETQPQPVLSLGLERDSFAPAAAGKADVLLKAKIDALDVTVLRGGGDEVGVWAKENGFDLPPDAPEVLDFYAQRSPIFMAAQFNADRAASRGQQIGDSTPVHAVIPTDDPWVPLRILGLGKADVEKVDADVYLLTDNVPAMLPRPQVDSDALRIKYNQAASPFLLRELRADRGMDWLPRKDMWLTYIRVKGEAGDIKHDLALDASGGRPSPVDAGLSGVPLSTILPSEQTTTLWAWALALGIATVAFLGADRFVAHKR